jgi:hypothetical protein
LVETSPYLTCFQRYCRSLEKRYQSTLESVTQKDSLIASLNQGEMGFERLKRLVIGLKSATYVYVTWLESVT